MGGTTTSGASSGKEESRFQHTRFSVLALLFVGSLVFLWQYNTILSRTLKGSSCKVIETAISLSETHVHTSATGSFAGHQENSNGQEIQFELYDTKAKIEVMKKMRARDTRFAEFRHFLSHIPKTGTTYASARINDLVENCPEYQALQATSRLGACNLYMEQISNYPTWEETRRCTMFVSEAPFSWAIIPDNTYTILRQPRAHVLSQYFHCAEARYHQKDWDKMPGSLDIWLETWVMAMDNATQAESNKGYKCFDPRNFQTRWMDFNHMNLDLSNVANKALLKDDLKMRYTILGDNAQMSKFLCLIVMRYTGWVPPVCNCTDYEETAAAEATGANHRRSSRRHLLKKLNGKKFSHGVKHHGATFKTSPQQDEWISKLTETDQYLYELAVEIFAEQVEEAEQDFGIKICNGLREPSNDTEASRLR